MELQLVELEWGNERKRDNIHTSTAAFVRHTQNATRLDIEWGRGQGLAVTHRDIEGEEAGTKAWL